MFQCLSLVSRCVIIQCHLEKLMKKFPAIMELKDYYYVIYISKMFFPCERFWLHVLCNIFQFVYLLMFLQHPSAICCMKTLLLLLHFLQVGCKEAWCNIVFSFDINHLFLSRVQWFYFKQTEIRLWTNKLVYMSYVHSSILRKDCYFKKIIHHLVFI